ncbi:MAG: hypothetical protein FJ265_14275 [Planctomycetes bacterium]|nr:hypothetical protein [Planctomycetota bacterium]
MVNRDFRDLFAAFTVHDVRFLIVGAYAVTFHTRPRFTKDLDVWVEPTGANAENVVRALAAFGAPLAEHSVAAADLARAGVVYQMGVPPNRIDVLTAVDGLDFASCWTRRVVAKYGDVLVAYLARQDLIVNKRAVGRPQDLEDVRALEREPS